jgi:hypothetical protein
MGMKLTGEHVEQIRRYFRNPDFFIEEILGIDTGSIDPEINVTQNPNLTTEQVCAYMVWYATFHVEQNVMLITDTQFHKGKANKIVQDFFAMVPEYMQHKQTKANKSVIQLETRSNILFELARGYTGKGWTLGLVVFDRFTKYKESIREEMMMGLFPSLCHGSQVVIVGEDDRYDW